MLIFSSVQLRYKIKHIRANENEFLTNLNKNNYSLYFCYLFIILLSELNVVFTYVSFYKKNALFHFSKWTPLALQKSRKVSYPEDCSPKNLQKSSVAHG